ncbi:trissin [Cylas formicarius]|uniref:trissin n=1 Tax=Cylas formicarius TaxID=197179 RepID=UPI002958D652|nr:trissin [Cylas formicarius]
MNKELVVAILILGAVWGEAHSCNRCGFECESACGTRHFRICCFNYLKKRSVDPTPLSSDPSEKFEMWLEKSRYPYHQPRRVPYDSFFQYKIGKNVNHDVAF